MNRVLLMARRTPSLFRPRGDFASDTFWSYGDHVGSSSIIRIGKYSGEFTKTYILFPAVYELQGTEFDNFSLHLQCIEAAEHQAIPLTQIHAAAVDNAVMPESIAEADAIPRTTAFAETTMDNLPDLPSGWLSLTELPGAILNEVFAREGWQSGNALMLILDCVGPDGSSVAGFVADVENQPLELPNLEIFE